MLLNDEIIAGEWYHDGFVTDDIEVEKFMQSREGKFAISILKKQETKVAQEIREKIWHKFESFNKCDFDCIYSNNCSEGIISQNCKWWQDFWKQYEEDNNAER